MKNKTLISLVVIVLFVVSTRAFAFQVFAKGSVTKTYHTADSFESRVSVSSGLAFELIPLVRIEGRYTTISSFQNKETLVGYGTITDDKSQSSIYSLGLDISFFGSKSSFQPFIFIGAGYVLTESEYTLTLLTGQNSKGYARLEGFTGNFGAGFRIRIARSMAIEIEVFAFTKNIDSSNPLFNLYGTAGVRLFI